MTLLPEIEVLRKNLEKDVVGKKIKDVTVKVASLVARHRNRPEFVKALSGHKIRSLERRGSHLVFELDEGAALVVRLGSQGTMSRETATAPLGKHTQVAATFTAGGALHVVDPTKDGELFVVASEELAELPELTPTGIDPLTDTFTWPAFSQELRRRNAPLRHVLKDDTFIVGLGDVYADEILWAAGLSGMRLSSALSSQEFRRLYRAVQEVLQEAVKQGGTDERADYDDEDEVESGEFLKVYGRTGEACPRCRQPIRQVTDDDGSEAYFCGSCQT
ncbi:MAG TPA: DNA-formamidopyrimidine glycosylase [Egibacteraceae bacterium]|nr:DNA-formamidopyrimidine glycosylase [Egibacteraceae bacterium]